MVWLTVVAMVGLALLAASTVRAARANPDRLVRRWADPPVQPRWNQMLNALGVGVVIFGFASMQRVIGAWAFLGIVPMALALRVPMVLHNRAVRRTGTALGPSGSRPLAS